MAYSLSQALALGRHVQQAYQLYFQKDPADFAPYGGYTLVEKIYADDGVKKLPGLPREKADKIAGKLAKSFGVGFLQDVEIWRNKTRIDNPLLCEEDGPVYQLRRWYEQFYVDVEDVTEEMTNRFEFEVDTTRANEAWEREVAENLARREAEVT